MASERHRDMPARTRYSRLGAVVEFLHRIGLPLRMEAGATGFCDGVQIVHGVLHVDPGCAPSALLHEAGHLAITPGRYRSLMDGNLAGGIRRMLDATAILDLDPDHPLSRAVIQCSDPEATAWAWSAGVELGLPPEVVILDEEYGGAGAEIRAYLLPSLAARGRVSGYIGIHGLAHAGMTALHNRGPLPMYPQLTTWLQIH